MQAGLVVRLLCAYCRISKFVLSIYYEKQRLPLAKSLGLRHMTYSKSTSLFELPQKLRPQDADRFEKRRPFLKNCVLSPKNGVSANAGLTQLFFTRMGNLVKMGKSAGGGWLPF